jgi:RNA polymerase sigma-B factor
VSHPAELLAARAAQGDEAATAELVQVMQPMVSAMATRFAGRVPRADLEQAGMVGLLRAAELFDPSHGTPFGGYAAPFVMGEMLSCVRQLTAPVRVPRAVAEHGRDVSAAIDRLTAENGRSPRLDEIAEACGLGEEQVLDALRAQMAARPVALEELDTERLGVTDDELEGMAQRLELGERVGRLDRRSRAVLLMRFGLELSQREIGERLGISQMHVSRLLRAALADLEREDGSLSG